MAAQIKDYDNSDNAAVLKGKVNTGTPALREKVNPGTPALREKVSPDTTALRRSVNTGTPALRENVNTGTPALREKVNSKAALQAKSQAMRASLADKKKSDGPIVSRGSAPDRSQFVQDVDNAAGAIGSAFKSVGSWADEGIKNLANTPFMPGTRDYLFGTQKSTLDKEGARLAAASNANTFKGSSLQGTGNNPVFQPGTPVTPTSTPAPAPVNPSSPFAKPNSNGMINVEDFKNVPPRSSSFNPSGMTIGNTSGSSQPAGMRQGGPQSPGNMVSDYTNLFAQDQKLFQAQMAAVNRNDGTQIFTGPGNSGAGRYDQGSDISRLQSRRGQLESQLANFDRSNPISKSMSVSDIVKTAMASSPLRKEMAQIDEQIFGRNDLANKIQQEIIKANAGIAEQQLRNKGSLDVQGVSGQYGLAEQAMRNQGAIDTQNIAGQNNLTERAMQIKGEKDISRQNNMFNSLMNKKTDNKFGDTEDSFFVKNSMELQKDQAKTLYQSQIEAGKSPEDALRTVKANFPDIYLRPGDDEKRVEGI